MTEQKDALESQVDITPLGMEAELVTDRISTIAEEWVAYNDDLLPALDDWR